MSLYFNGRNAYVEVADDESLDLTTVPTILTRIKLFKYPAFILIKGPSASYAKANYVLNVDSVGRLFIAWGDGTDYQYNRWTGPFPLNEWVFIAANYNGIWINGEEVDIYRYTSSGSDVTPTPNDSPLYIGKTGNNLGFVEGFMGFLRIYNVLLEQSQIQQLYSNPYARVAMDNCVLWLPLTENRGSRVIDRSGNNNHGTIYNARWVTERQRGVYLNGRDAYISVPDSDTLNIESNNAFTIGIWVHLLSKDELENQQFWAKHKWGRKGYMSLIYKGDQQVYFYIACEQIDGSVKWIITGTGLYADDLMQEWRLILQRTYLVGDVLYHEFFVDGEVIKSVSYSEITRLVNCTRPLEIGSYSGDSFLNAKLGGAYYWNRTLTNDEILNLYLNPDNPPLDGLKLWLAMNEGWGRRLVDHSGNGNHAMLYGDARWV
ncbi:hypothetical protein DRP04_00815 [Archaeoglobales archaeon]|nr:MAG: hypothetical protein DRP04_00815 [Archaeoglobales archaeon]